MKSLIKKFANTELGLTLRNSFNFKPVSFRHYEKKYSITVSDAFLWRTDSGYTTKFKYSDILNLFYKIKDSWIEFHFYSKNNKLIKILKIENLNLCNEIDINPELLNNLKDYGVFYLYHFVKKSENTKESFVISNRCYLGYSINQNLYSFVHGNILAKSYAINKNEKFLPDIVKMSLFKNQNYTIQKFFNNFDKNELAFVNPTSKIIYFSIENKNYELKPRSALLIETSKSILSVKSNCLFFRPTVFSYKDKYLDVHHG